MDLPRDDAVANPPAYTTAGTPGYFSDSGTRTVVSAQVLNHIVRELLGLLEGLGGEIDPLNDQQIAPLLLARCAGATPESVVATKDGNVYSATVTGWITKILCESATQNPYLVVTAPSGRIPLSVLCYTYSEPHFQLLLVRWNDTGAWVFGFEPSDQIGTTDLHVVVIWGTAP